MEDKRLLHAPIADLYQRPDQTYYLIVQPDGEHVDAVSQEDALDMYYELNGLERFHLPPGTKITATYWGTTDPEPHYVYKLGDRLVCTCKGYGFRRTCKHVEEQEKLLGQQVKVDVEAFSQRMEEQKKAAWKSVEQTRNERRIPEGSNLHIRLAYPYGAPMIHLRGNATKDPRMIEFMKKQGFNYDMGIHAWTGVNFNTETEKHLHPDIVSLAKSLGFNVVQGGRYDIEGAEKRE